MARPRYDDWNFMGESLESNSRIDSEQKVNHIIVLFIISCVLLLVMGLVCVYSASYPESIAKGYSSYYYLLRQLIYVGIGLATGIIAIVLPESLFKMITPAYMFACFLVTGVNLFVKSSYIAYESIIGLIVLSVVMYLSLYFANRGNHISRLRELLFPTLFSTVFVFLIAVQQNVTYLFLFLIAVIMMFAIGGVGVGGVILLILYTLVPAVLWTLSDPDKLSYVLDQIIPGLSSSTEGAQAALRQQCLASGGWFGRGIGMGQFKFQGITGISREYIMCNISEELGFTGILAIVILFIIIAYCGYRCSYYLRDSNTHYSNLSAGLTTVVVWQFVLNILSVLNLGFFRGVSLPFFSLGSVTAVVILDCCIILRCIIRGLKKKQETGTELTESQQPDDSQVAGISYDSYQD